MLEKQHKSLATSDKILTAATGKEEAQFLSRYTVRSILAVLLGSFALLSIYLQNPLMKELLLASIIIGCTLILDEVSEKHDIIIKPEDRNGTDHDR